MNSISTIKFIFLFQAIASTAMFTRIPDIQRALGLEETELGLALMGQPAGALSMYFVSSYIVERFGTKTITLWGQPTLVISTILVAIAPNIWSATLCLFLFGSSFALTNITMNVEADRVEATTGKRVMNTCHGLWSMGFLVASLGGVVARGLDIPVWVHFLLTVPIILLAMRMVVWPMQVAKERAHGNKNLKKPLMAVPTITTMALVGFGISAVLLESGVRSWSVIFMRDSFDTVPWLETLTLPAFFFTMAMGRIFSDKWIEAYGPQKIAVVTILTAISGLCMVIWSPNLVVALIGFGVLGLGICVIYPLTISAAAQIGDRPSSQNVTSVTMVTSFAMLFAPAMMGMIAGEYGIRISFAIFLPLLFLSLMSTKLLNRQPN
ncbi:MAG: MFS transporter [Rhizobiales bacterium]|nr:MFS transporter [Hyphomicrobiales bacterium]NRB12793.1 MFS transporter [Hyphomicrobiales bacterium]